MGDQVAGGFAQGAVQSGVISHGCINQLAAGCTPQVIVGLFPPIKSIFIRQFNLCDIAFIAQQPEVSIDGAAADVRRLFSKFKINIISAGMIAVRLHSFQNELSLFCMALDDIFQTLFPSIVQQSFLGKAADILAANFLWLKYYNNSIES